MLIFEAVGCSPTDFIAWSFRTHLLCKTKKENTGTPPENILLFLLTPLWVKKVFLNLILIPFSLVFSRHHYHGHTDRQTCIFSRLLLVSFNIFPIELLAEKIRFFCFTFVENTRRIKSQWQSLLEIRLIFLSIKSFKNFFSLWTM